MAWNETTVIRETFILSQRVIWKSYIVAKVHITTLLFFNCLLIDERNDAQTSLIYNVSLPIRVE